MLKKIRLVAVCILTGLVFIAHAGENNGSKSPAAGVAEDFSSMEEKELALNRRFHAELIRESAFYRQLSRGDDDIEGRLTGYRLYLALVEEFARVRSPDPRQRAQWLNTVYEQQIEITESCIKGRGNIADRLEYKF